MTVLRVPAVLAARLLVAVMRDLAGALGALLHGIGRAALRLLWVASAVVIVDAILVRPPNLAMPPVVWLALIGAWLAATAVWLLGGLLEHATRPRPGLTGIREAPGTRPVSPRRIQEWESAWQRALRYQQTSGQQADRDDQGTSERQRREQAGSATAGSPYEILGVKPDATPEQIRTAYRELAMRMHPDHNPGFVAEATERFAAIHSAYELLSDPERRPIDDQHSRSHQ